MDINVWFYTFSTLAQVVSAIVGLFAVFVVYRVQEFSDDLNSYRVRAISTLSYISLNTESFVKYSVQVLQKENDKKLLSIFNELLDIKEGSSRISVDDPYFNREIYQLYKKCFDTKSNIFEKLKNILLVGLSIIGLALICLATTQIIQPVKISSILIMFLATSLFLFFLILIGKSIYLIVSDY